jgi:DNA gyrase inhibitor GyrI
MSTERDAVDVIDEIVVRLTAHNDKSCQEQEISGGENYATTVVSIGDDTFNIAVGRVTRKSKFAK